MRTLGLIGGMSWESTALYYRYINEITRERQGGLHSAPLALVSVDFASIEAMQMAGDWAAAGEALATAARQLEAAGAEILVLCTNTMHRVADAIEAAVVAPLLHIADATAEALLAAGHRQAGLLGTRFTMEQAFYRGRLEGHGLDVRVPNEAGRAEVHRVIYEELCLGEVRDASRQAFLRAIDEMGAQAVILGCTEIGMLVTPEHTAVPLFDTTRVHAEAAVTAALAP